MDKEKEIDQLVKDMERVFNIIKKIENFSLEDLDTLKKESILIEEEFKKRYGKPDPPQTNSQEA